MDINHFREFVYLAETLNFNTASQHFFMSTSALSKHIASMEETLGIRLFERDRHHVKLTDQGQAFYTDAIGVLAAYDKALHNIETRKIGYDSILKVGYLRNASRPFLAQFVQYLTTNYPNISLEINCMEYIHLIDMHRTHQVDVLLTMNLDPEARWACDYEPIYTDHFYAIANMKSPLASMREGITSNDLCEKRLVLPYRDAYPGMAERFEQFLPEPVAAFDATFYRDIDTLYYEVESHGRVGFSSGHNIRQFSDRVTFLPVLDMDTEYEVCAQWLKDMSPETVKIVRDAAAFCRKHMQNHPIPTTQER